MSAENDLLGYDEEAAVKFIQKSLPQELKGKFSNDEITYIIDIIYDFYEDKGLMDSDVSDDTIVDIDEDELVEYVLKNTRKDKITKFTPEEITYIIRGELDYCDSIDMFE
ncbi:hypothetical protein [Dysgonomonas sp. 520]|uniref:hypothetical protein n=1 Tax=Dysgonomonas sp. 520 TaxID=2302931 RepID=UPI0013D2363D|nr:hypothetical protein [Dysgonomonas sp. 520]NDW08076.1 hypothetical protein [Dysgonomonas sp. 520]